MYAQKNEPGVSEAIELAKTLERRRCGHHPDQYPEPLSTQECLQSVVDPKDSGLNKHRYVVASQEQEVRRMLRGIKGVPLIYIKRSVMILEPMADESVQARAREERSKFRADLKNTLGKRKRAGEDDEGADGEKEQAQGNGKPSTEEQKKKKKKGHGPKGPNPLAVQKKKSKSTDQPRKPSESDKMKDVDTDAPAKRKRRRKNKSADVAIGEGAEGVVPAEVTASADD